MRLAPNMPVFEQVTTQPSPWEFYAARELQRRLVPEAGPSVLSIPQVKPNQNLFFLVMGLTPHKLWSRGGTVDHLHPLSKPHNL